MNYLVTYGITEEQIEIIKKVLEEADVDEDIFKYSPEKVCKILDLFTSIGVKDMFSVIVTGPYMFYDTVSSIKVRIDSYGNSEELARLINEDPYNLSLVDLI